MKDIKNINMTIFTDFMSQDNFKDLIYSNYSVDKCIIGALEQTENGKEHFHVFVSLNRKVNFDGFKKVFHSAHIEQVYGSIKQNYDYCCKNGEPYYISFNIKDFLEKEEKKEEIEKDLIKDIFIEKLPLKIIIMKYPKYAIYNIRSIRELIEIREEDDKKNN